MTIKEVSKEGVMSVPVASRLLAMQVVGALIAQRVTVCVQCSPGACPALVVEAEDRASLLKAITQASSLASDYDERAEITVLCKDGALAVVIAQLQMNPNGPASGIGTCEGGVWEISRELIR